MIISNVNIGSGPGANDGESIYSAFYKVNQNFANVQSNVNSLTNSVSSVAGRTGNVTLTINDIVGLNTSYAINGNVTAANIGMKGYVDAKIAANITALIDSAPGALDTLNELAAALNDDASFATTIVNTVTLANTIQSNQITAANLGMKGYVDSVASQSIYGNSNVGSYLTTYTGNIKAGFANITGSVLGLNALTVGLPGIEIFGNTVAQFHSNIDQSLNVAVHNLSPGSQATSGFMASADVGDEDNHHTLMGIVNSGWDITHPFLKPLDSLLLGIGGNLVLGTRSVSGPSIPKDIAFVVGDGSTLEVLRINAQSDLLQANLVLGANVGIKFNDGTRQTSAYSNVQTAAYTNLSTYAYNANVTAANLGMKGYVDSVASQSIYGNANVASYLHANNYSPYSNVNVAVFTNLSTYAYNANVTAANLGMKGYVDNAVASSGYGNVQVEVFTNLSNYAYNANVTAANLGMKGYVDSLTYSNVQVDVHTNLSNYAYNANVTAANVGMKGYVDSITYADSDVQDYLNSLYTINIGYPVSAIRSDQGEKSIAIGPSTGSQNQGANCIAIGASAGAIRQTTRAIHDGLGNIGGAIAIGGGAGQYGQGYHSVSIGYYPSNVYTTGQLSQGNGAVSLGAYAGAVDQGENAVAIGYRAGISSQYPNSIVINASGTDLNANTAGLYINPVRQDDSNVANIVYYNITTKEMTYGPAAGSSYGNVQVATYLPTHTGNVAAGNVKVSTAYRFETGNVTITNESGYVSLNPDTVYSGTAGVKIGGSGFILGPNGARNLTLNYNSVSGALGLQGNVTIGSAGSGNLWVMGNVIARDITGGNILATGTSGVLGFNSGGFVQQATSNATQVTSNTSSGNIQLMSIDIGAHAVHTVTFACNKLTTNDLLLIKHINGGLTSVYVDAYVVSDGLGIIWIRDITGNGTGAFTPMLKYAIIRAPSS